MANQALTALYEALLESYPTPGPPMVVTALRELGAEIARLEGELDAARRRLASRNEGTMAAADRST